MIIVKTSNGDVFINDRELVKLTHDRHNHFVYALVKGEINIGLTSRHIKPIEKVESVTYINEQTSTERKDDGSEIAFLRRQLAEEKNLCGFVHTMAKQIESHLRDLANYIIQEVNYGDEIPTEIRKRLRDRAEESKAYSLDDSKWWERRQYMETHQQQAEAESARTAELNEKVEQQAARIIELENELADTKGEFIKFQMEVSRQNEANETQNKRNFWQRIFNF